jgi:hypothetical protein
MLKIKATLSDVQLSYFGVGNVMLCDNTAHRLCTGFVPVADYGSSKEMDKRRLKFVPLG